MTSASQPGLGADLPRNLRVHCMLVFPSSLHCSTAYLLPTATIPRLSWCPI
jgi:hypothetical protein